MDIAPADAAAGAGFGLASLIGTDTATASLWWAPARWGDALILNGLSLALKHINLQEASKSMCSCFTLKLSSGLLQNNPLQASSCPHQGTLRYKRSSGRARSLCCRHSRCLLLQRKRQEVRQEENTLLPACPPPFLQKSSWSWDLARFCSPFCTQSLWQSTVRPRLQKQCSLAIQGTLWPCYSPRLLALFSELLQVRHVAFDF